MSELRLAAGRRLACAVLFAVFIVCASGASVQTSDDGGVFGAIPFEILAGDCAVSELLKKDQLLHESGIQVAEFGRSGLLSCVFIQGQPRVSFFDLLLPVSDGRLESKVPEVASVGRLRVEGEASGVCGPLTPTVNQGNTGSNEGGPKNSGARRKQCNYLYEFLFLWGHEWWVLVIWWGLIAFPIVVLIDTLYGWYYEEKLYKRLYPANK